MTGKEGIGGFLGLDRSLLGPAPCEGARVGLTTGRACLGAILDLIRPTIVYMPWFVCPEVHRVVTDRGPRIEWLELDHGLSPVLPASMAPDAVLLVVNYFGLLGPVVDRLADQSAVTVLIDDAQAFFHRPAPGVWAFNSARKFFGVPDGAWLFGPADPLTMERARPATDHLEARLQPDALERYRRAEADQPDTPLRVSLLSTVLLGHTDLAGVAALRRANYARLHEHLAPRNRLDLPLTRDAVPMCYPFLPQFHLPHREFHRRSIWVPRYWPDMPDIDGHEWERELVEALLPLPIDQRYGQDEMDQVAEAVLELLQEGKS